MTHFSGELSYPPALGPFDGSMFHTVPAIPPGYGPVGPEFPTEAMRQPAAATIQRCYRWLEAASPMLPQVAALAPGLVTAVQQYAARQYAASLRQATVVLQSALYLRATVPGLPVL